MKISALSKIKGINVKWMQPICVLLILFALPIYEISNALFEIAVLRDKSSSFFERKGVKKLINKVNGIFISGKKKCWGKKHGEIDNGLGFADFTQELENGKYWFDSQDKERITMTSYDGLKLVAYYLPAEVESDRVLILMHGYRNDGLHDFAGLVRFYHEMGYHLLVPHQRSHGESEGKYICFGVKERHDLKQWAEYIAKRFGGKCSIFLTGISMGGATVLMAAGLSLPEQVKGIIADCAFTSPWDIFSRIIEKDCHLPKFPFLYAADFICRRKAGFRFKECSTITCMKECTIPVLFIHGGKDAFVPTEMSYRNYDACGAKKQILVVDRAAHGTSNMAEPQAYRSMVIGFMEGCQL